MHLGFRLLLLLLGLCLHPAARAEPAFEDSMAQRTLACTACHGPQGQAGPDGYYPRLAGKPAAYLFNQLVNIRSGRRHYPLMAGLLDTLDDGYLHAIADYFSALSIPYPAPSVQKVSAEELERGRALVQNGKAAIGLPACTQCHGEQLLGVNPSTPGLLGLPADYLNAQLGGWQSGQRHAAAPDCMAEVARRLSANDISAMAHWLSAQAVPAKPHAAAQRPAATPATQALRCGSDNSAAAAASTRAPSAARPASAATSTALPTAAASPTRDAALIARGNYLARLGNCAQCHSARGGPAYGGGRAIDTPFGAVRSSNITPDPQHGIGKWSGDDFWRALHQGLSKDGHALSPAFPYTSYTLLSRTDSDALFAYLQTVPPAQQPNQAHALRWPFGTQLALRVWRALYFKAGSDSAPAAPSQVAADRLASWQRGHYLVQGLGHCMECHAARNALGARKDAADQGGSILPGGQWFAPSLADAAGASVAAWSETDIAQLLQTGHTRQALATGPMAEVVAYGTQYLSDTDAQAMAVYLKALPQSASVPATAAKNAGAGSSLLQQGARLYEKHCADCHGANGQGRAGAYPALAGNRVAKQTPAHNLISSVLAGGFGAATAGHAQPFGMPPFALRLSDAELAAVLSYVRSAWGNRASGLSEFDINTFRRSLPP